MKMGRAKQTAATAVKFLRKVQMKNSMQHKSRLAREQKASNLKREIKQWCQGTLPSTYGSYRDIRRHKQCMSCHSTTRHARSSEAKIQSLSTQIARQKHLANQLQDSRSKISILTREHDDLKKESFRQHRQLLHNKAVIQSLKAQVSALTKENENTPGK